MNIKTCLSKVVILTLLALVSAQNRYRNQRPSTNRNRNIKNEPVEEGRTLGILGPILGLGLSSLARPLATVGYDAPYVPASTYRPISSSTDSVQSDPYYGGFGGYSGYPSQYYGGFNYYPQYHPFRPYYSAPFYGGYRPIVYPGNYGAYPQYNNYYGQRPVYNNQRPAPIPQRPTYSQLGGLNNLAAPSRPTATTTPTAGSGSATPQINSAQAAQVANLLGQLLGSQLRPLLNQGTAAAAHDVPNEDDKRDKTRRYF